MTQTSVKFVDWDATGFDISSEEAIMNGPKVSLEPHAYAWTESLADNKTDNGYWFWEVCECEARRRVDVDIVNGLEIRSEWEVVA